MKLTDSIEQSILRRTTRDLVTAHGDRTARNRAEHSNEGFDGKLDGALRDLGMVAALVSGEAGLLDAATVLEECGRAAVAAPVVAELVAYAHLVAAGGTELASATHSAVGDHLTVGDRVADGAPGVAVEWPGAAAVSVADEHRTLVVRLDAAQVKPEVRYDAIRGGVIDVDASTDVVIDVADPTDRSRRLRNVLHGVEAVGLALGAIELTRDYALERHQFGRAIGTFQVVQHTLANAWIRASGARLLCYEALWLAAYGDENRRISLSAVAQASLAAEEAVLAAQQFHGGVGYTLDYGLHHYYRRARTQANRIGGKSAAAAAVSAAVLAAPLSNGLRHVPPRCDTERSG